MTTLDNELARIELDYKKRYRREWFWLFFHSVFLAALLAQGSLFVMFPGGTIGMSLSVLIHLKLNKMREQLIAEQRDIIDQFKRHADGSILNRP